MIYSRLKGKMTTSPYSLDLRNKVIKYLKSGRSQRSASETFDLNPSTISRWWLRYKREGNCMARLRLGREPRVTLSQVILFPSYKAVYKLVEYWMEM